MIRSKRSKIRNIFLGVTLCAANAGVVAAFDEPGGGEPFIGQARAAAQSFDSNITKCVGNAKYGHQRNLPLTLITWLAPEQLRTVAADQSEPQSPTFSRPPSDLPQTPDPEPEPPANLPGPEMPPSIQPKSERPGLPPPPMPQPAAPHLAPAPPPMPQPAEPPPLSHRPDLNPAHPGTTQ